MEPTVTIRNKRTGEIRQIAQSQLGGVPQPTQPQGGGLSSLLPLIGAIGGSFLPGLGTIAGGALGAGAGTLLKQGIQGQGNLGEIAKETALGAGGGVFGKGLAGILGKTIGRAAPFASEAVGQGGSRLAAKTLASNFIVPAKVTERIGPVEEALQKIIADKVPIPSSLKGYQTLANQITGDTGIITKATRKATYLTPQPINFDEPLMNAQSLLSREGAVNPQQAEETMSKIRNYFSNKNYMGPGQLNAEDTFDVIKQLEKQGYKLFNQGTHEFNPRPDLEAMGKAFLGVADDLEAQIGRAIDNTGVFPQIQQEVVEQLTKISPTLAAKAQNATSFEELRGIASPYVRISKATESTLLRQQTPFTQAGLGLGGRAAGAAGGFALGGLPGAVAGAALAPAAQGLAQAAQPAITGVAARGILGAGRLGAKIPRGLPTAAAGQIGARAMFGGEIPEAQAAEPLEGQILPDVSENPQQERLRQAFFLSMLSKPKQAATLKTIFEFGFPKPLAGTADREASLKVGEQAVDDALRTAKKGYGPLGGGLAQKSLEKLGGLGVPSSVVSANTRYQLLRQSVVRALQGARMSDVDIKLALQYIPQITDTENTAKQKLSVLKNFLTQTRQYLKRLPTNPEESGSLPLPQGGL